MTENGQDQPMVEAVGIHKSFGSVEVLRGIDLTVQPGEVACVIGPSESGICSVSACSRNSSFVPRWSVTSCTMP